MKFNSVFHISEGMIKFLQMTTGQKKTVSAADVILTGKKSDAEISQALIDLAKQRKLNFAENRVTVVFPRSWAILRNMAFPSLQESEIRSMIDLQVGSRIPYAREEVEIDFQLLSKTQEGYSKVAVVIIPQEIAMRFWKIFSNSKIPVQSITISSIGLWLLYQQNSAASEELGAIFDMDVKNSEVCLCRRSHWLNSREIPIGIEQMQKDGYVEIMRQWELTQSNTGSDKSAENLNTVLLVSSADKTLELGAEIAKVQGDLKVKEIHLTKSLTLARGVQWPTAITEQGVSFASLAGIAMNSQRPPIDLVPRSVRQLQDQQVYRKQMILLCVWAAAALISLGLALGMGYFKKNVELGRLEDQLREAKHDARKVEDQLKKVYDIEAMLKDRLIFSDLAHEIYRLLPAQVYLVSITISDGNTLSLQGISSNSVEINQFQKDMVNSQTFANVSLDYVNKRVTQQGEVDYFKITSTLRSISSQGGK